MKLFIDSQAINVVKKTKWLGIIINDELTEKWYINYITGKILQFLYKVEN